MKYEKDLFQPLTDDDLKMGAGLLDASVTRICDTLKADKKPSKFMTLYFPRGYDQNPVLDGVAEKLGIHKIELDAGKLFGEGIDGAKEKLREQIGSTDEKDESRIIVLKGMEQIPEARGLPGFKVSPLLDNLVGNTTLIMTVTEPGVSRWFDRESKHGEVQENSVIIEDFPEQDNPDPVKNIKAIALVSPTILGALQSMEGEVTQALRSEFERYVDDQSNTELIKNLSIMPEGFRSEDIEGLVRGIVNRDKETSDSRNGKDAIDRLLVKRVISWKNGGYVMEPSIRRMAELLFRLEDTYEWVVCVEWAWRHYVELSEKFGKDRPDYIEFCRGKIAYFEAKLTGSDTQNG